MELQQEVGTAPGPAQSLRLVRPTIQQEIGGPFGDCRPDPQAATVALAIFDRAISLTDAIAVQDRNTLRPVQRP